MNREAEEQGYLFAQTLAGIFTPNPQASSADLLSVAMVFAEWTGYRETRLGMAYCRGFASGFESAKPKQIAETNKTESGAENE